MDPIIRASVSVSLSSARAADLNYSYPDPSLYKAPKPPTPLFAPPRSRPPSPTLIASLPTMRAERRRSDPTLWRPLPRTANAAVSGGSLSSCLPDTQPSSVSAPGVATASTGAATHVELLGCSPPPHTPQRGPSPIAAGESEDGAAASSPLPPSSLDSVDSALSHAPTISASPTPLQMSRPSEVAEAPLKDCE